MCHNAIGQVDDHFIGKHPQYGQSAGGTHPTGMRTFHTVFGKNLTK